MTPDSRYSFPSWVVPPHGAVSRSLKNRLTPSPSKATSPTKLAPYAAVGIKTVATRTSPR
jgi:hypothetical protein